MVDLCILQNADFEGPGALIDWAIARGHRFKVVLAYAGEKVSDSFTHLVILGTPRSVHDLASIPWLCEEAQLVRQALFEGKYILGICFGAQLLAHLHGGTVSAGPHAEIGWHPAPEVNFFQWHRETYSVPATFQAFGKSAAGYPAGFSKGRVVAITGHPEITPALIETFIERCWNESWYQAEKEKGHTRFVQPPSALRASAINPEEAFRFFDAWAIL